MDGVGETDGGDEGGEEGGFESCGVEEGGEDGHFGEMWKQLLESERGSVCVYFIGSLERGMGASS